LNNFSGDHATRIVIHRSTAGYLDYLIN
jgi:hypothetical protein